MLAVRAARREGAEFFGSTCSTFVGTLTRRYLNETREELIIVPWGERTLHHEEFHRLGDDVAKILQAHAHIHKGFEILAC